MGKLKSAIIIGGGVSGLAAGIKLAKQGLDVKLFEINDKLGGSCATIVQEGYVFAEGALWVVAPGLLEHGFHRMGLDLRSLLPMRRINANMKLTLPDSSTVTIDNENEVTVVKPDGAVDTVFLRHELNNLLKSWEPVFLLFVGDLMRRRFSFKHLIKKGWRQLPRLRRTVATELKRHISNTELRAALAALLAYSVLPPEKMPSSLLVPLVSMFKEGYFLPVGGMGKIPDTLGKVLISMGCDVFLNSEVERIRVKDGNISGVEVEGHNPFDADIVISSLSAIQTYQDLIDPEDVPKKLRKQVEKTPLSASVFSVQLGLANKIDVRSHFNYIFPSMEEQYKLYTDVSYNQGMLFYTVPTITVPELAPEGGSVVEMFTPINQNLPIDVWDEKRKDQVADSTIQMLSRLHDIDVVVRRVCSPRDFQTNLHLPNGAIYGMTAGIDPWKYYSHKSPISGLYLTGQTTYPGFGISPAMMSGIITAETILEFERSQ